MTPDLRQHIRAAVHQALAEDLVGGDATTRALFDRPAPARGTIVAEQPLTAAGIAVARTVFASVDPGLKIRQAVVDGARVRRGAALMTIEGDGRSLLMAERVALNFLQHLSGVATLTASLCDAIRGYRTRILDTRKTTPGLRTLEKWAVRLGGGRNHRRTLGDGVLIKDNHVALLRGQGFALDVACRRARERAPHHLKIIVETQTLDDVRLALAGEADVVLLDNMTPAQVREAASLIKGRAAVEASGGITVRNARDFAAAGADFLSVGALTHSAPAADLSMDIVPLRVRGTRRRR